MAWYAFWRRKQKPQPVDVQRGGMRIFGGRRFKRGVPYILPSDAGELNRLDFQHYLLRSALRGNYASPLRDPRAILDVACGTGRWAIEMASMFPQASTVGFDMTPLPPDAGAAHNFTFVQGNMFEGLPFPDDSFDFVHQRLVTVAIPTTQWLPQVQELLRVTRPGGWVELVEGDLLPGGAGLTMLNDLGERMSLKRGMSFSNASRIDEYLRQAGARQIERRVIYLPVGQVAGRLGAMAETDYLAILTSVRGFLISQGLITEEEHTQALEQAQAELASGRFMWPFYIAYGQK
ncbi:MAG TPA: methyltransferase domain-containing protein [Ktedonobacterales bacterium]